MVSPFQIVMELNSPRGGWTEQFFTTADGLTQAYNQSLDIINTRMGLSPASVSLLGIRVAQQPDAPLFLPTPRVSQPIPSTVLGYLPTLAGTAPDLLQNKVLISCTGAGGFRRNIWVGGMADAQTTFRTSDGASIPGPFLGAGLALYYQRLNGRVAVMRNLIPATTTGYRWNPVTNVEGSGLASPTMAISWTMIDPIVPGDYIEFGRVNRKIFPGLVGRWQVVATNGLKLIIPYYNNFPQGINNVVGNLRMRKVGIVYNAITNSIFNGFRAHKVGKSLGEPRGRAKAVSFRR